ncbi:Hint domain-containing protein [Antarctobacter heliothermus]|uniref:Hint domain-containing protein n=1 Tax=Antarctobacter heliothermus TaxID=74033 RepID=A0A239GI86_9RHOB|nr:Hint domain-containing protein [Antarctobacter heliothermus]SNS68605.1 Hint domain-containing protein [Antarctobacter heliothermus]
MPTSFNFESQVGIGPKNTPAVADPTNIDVEITAVVDDGSILPGDDITLTQLDFFPPPEWIAAGLTPVNQGPDPMGSGLDVYTANAYYYGTRDFFSSTGNQTGFIFGADPFFFNEFEFLILFDNNFDFSGADSVLVNEIESWNQFSTNLALVSQPACFLAGTAIATPEGTCAVEDLQIGQIILTADGTAVPVRWIGRQIVDSRFSSGKAHPVRFRAGALGDGLPLADLTITADHGMILDGLVINASALINGTTIDWVPLADLPAQFTVYHIETEVHDVILANGAPSETFIDYRDRRAFDNYHQYLALYGCERIIPEMPSPRISSARMLPMAIRDRIKIGGHLQNRAATA